MTTTIETAMKALIATITKETKGDEALKLSQAALNLAHVKAVLGNIK